MSAEDDAVPHTAKLDSSVKHAGDAPCEDAPRKEPISNKQSAHVLSLTQYWIDGSLRYVSHASNESLGACFVGLGATTYLVLGRVGLLLMGVVGGIALHAAWESSIASPNSDLGTSSLNARKRNESGLEVLNRVWQWRSSANHRQDDTHSDGFGSKSIDYSHLPTQTAAALDAFTDAVIDIHVKSWYQPMCPGDTSFPVACRKTMVSYMCALAAHFSQQRPINIFVDLVTNSTSILIVFLSELSIALNTAPMLDASQALEQYTDQNPDSSLARMLNDSQQDRKLEVVAEDMLSSYLDAKAYDCPPVSAFLRNVLARLVLATTLETCSKPHFINEWIVYLLEDAKPTGDPLLDGMAEKPSAGGNDLISQVSSSAELSDADGDSAHHRDNLDRAEDAMEEAMKEAKRLTQLIIEEENSKQNLVRSAPPPDQHAESLAANDAAARRSGDAAEPSTLSTSNLHTTQALATPRIGVSRSTSTQSVKASPTVESEDKAAFTLHNAKISIFDDGQPGDTSKYKTKPNVEYLIQIESASSAHSGWMTSRKYADFETLHEVLRRIATITGCPFTQDHANLPAWKGQAKSHVRQSLESYLGAALSFRPLADCEGMKRFLDKDRALQSSSNSSKGVAWSDPNLLNSMGKNMIGALTKAPKNVAGGGKAFIEGVSNVLNVNDKRAATPPRGPINPTAYAIESASSYAPSRLSQDSRRSTDTRPPRTSVDITFADQQNASDHDSPRRSPLVGQKQNHTSFTPRKNSGDVASQNLTESGDETWPASFTASAVAASNENQAQNATTRKSDEVGAVPSAPHAENGHETRTSTRHPEKSMVMTESETQVTVELMFAVITELYTLSSAWNFRRTLLNAAKTFLLRPGNPQLEAIRVMIQESVIEQNCSDKGMAALITKVRENAVPTEAELAAWPTPPTESEMLETRVKARKLLVERGMPQALMSVMGAAASGEALGKVFDCLQVEKVARSVVFGLLLQALRATVQ